MIESFVHNKLQIQLKMSHEKVDKDKDEYFLY